jgi:NADPH:quinone reductase-like Zn-dependent oxidoreductase
MVCLGKSSRVKDGNRDLHRIGLAALRTPRISVLKLFDANTGIYALNALHVLKDDAWVEKLTKSMTDVEAMGLRPHVGKVFEATDVSSAHAFLETKQATGKVLLRWQRAN